MSGGTSGDVSLINDEDLLRKMWQDTEDFGRKKEIRAHMYKLREARLRDFYNSGEVNTDIQRSTTKTTESKSCSASTHADSLADHSFISMKTKEIRDSESPTRDASYRVIDKGLANQGWTVVSSNKKSDDGKTFTTSKIATTSGSEKIDGGKLDYAAKNEQQASVYRDGDDKNFTKAVGASTSSVIKQEAVGGDENSSFRSSATKTSSSSKYVTEHRSTSGDVIETPPTRMIAQNQNDDYLVSRKTYTDNIPSELKNHPNFVEGKTKVTRETRTLPDGTTVTTTRYEVKGGTTNQSSKSSQYSTSTQQKSTESRTNQNESKSTRYISEPSSTTSTTVTRHVYDDLQPATTRTVTRTVKDHHVDSRDGASRSTVIYDSRNEPRDDAKTTNKTTVVRTVYDTREQPTHDSSVTSTTRVVKNTFDTNVNTCNVSDANSAIVKTTVVKNIYDVNDRPVDDSRTSTVTKTIVTKQVDDFRPQVVDDSRTSTTTKTTVTKHVDDFRPQVVDDSRTTTTKTTVIKHVDDFRPQVVDDSTTSTTSKTTVIKHVDNLRDEKRQVEQHTTDRVNRHEANEKFITIEQEDTRNRMVPKAPEQVRVVSVEKQPKPVEQPEKKSDIPDRRPKPDEKYELPERRQPIKPGKSELSDKPKPTEGQYETTYRTEFTNKRISVDVSPTHDAFARSLRAVSPDRISKCSSPSRSLRTSTNSLRSSTSPEKNRHPSRLSPERRSTSPRKATSHETITKTRTNADRITRKHNTTEIDSSTLTRRKNKPRTRSRSPSPTSIASDIEFIRNTDIVTDLDTNETTVVTKSRPASLEITRRTTKRVTDRSPTSPLTDTSPKKNSPREVPRTGSLRNISPAKDVSPKSDRPFKRTDTYEERCRQILGISNQTEQRKNSLERVTTKKTTTKSTPEKSSPSKEISSPTRKSPEKKMSEPVQRKSPTKERSPEKQSVTRSPDRKSPVKDTTKINEFPSQVRRVPEKEPLGQYPEKKSPVKEGPKISEFPSQIRKSPEKEPSRQYPEKKSPVKEGPKISELPSQIRKVPEREDLEPYPEKKVPTREGPTINEFPSQIRKPSEKEPLEPYPERKSSLKEGPKICEFPSQIRKSPEKEPLEPYPEKKVPTKEGPKVSEFPSQIRRSPEKEVLGPYPEKKSPVKEGPKISEFPSQIKRVPEKEPLEAYPEKTRPQKEGPKVSEFPSQVRKLPEREPLEQYPEKKTPLKGEKKSPEDEPFEQICEFPSQVRKPYEKEPLEPYPEKRSPVKEGPKVSEFPSQIRKPTEKEPLEPYPEKRVPVKEGPKVSAFPSQIRKPTEKEPLEPYPEKKAPVKEGPKVSEFPSQVRRQPEREPLEPYPERKTPAKEGPKVSEFPSQIRRSPEKEPLEPYPEKKVPERDSPQINEFPSQIRKSPEKEPSQHLPERNIIDKEPLREHPSGKYPSKIPKYGEHDESPERIRPKTYTCKLTPSNVDDEEELIESPRETVKIPSQPQKDKPKLNEFPSQVSKSPEKKPTDKKSPEKAPEKVRPKKDSPKTDELPSQIKKVSEKETPDRNKINRGLPKTQKEPSPTKKVPGKLEQPGKIRPTSPIKKPKKRTDSTSSSETDEENEEVEEIHTVMRISELEGRVPVDEPLATKKFISQLCRDDEIQRTDLSRKETQTTLNREVMETGTRTQTKTVKKDSPRKPQELFIDNEKKDTNVTINKYSSPRTTSPTKKPLTEKNTVNTTGRTTSTTTSTVTSKTTRRITDEKTKPKDVKKTAQKIITLYDIENMNENKEDNRVHVRTHRIDDTINKKVAKSVVNGDLSKKAPITRRPQPVKPEEPKTRKPIDKRPQKVVSKTVTETETRRTTTEQKTPKRHVVTTTITVSPTTRTSPTKSPTKTPTTKTTSAPKPSKVTTKKPKLQNGNVSSDEESIVDSLDGELTQEISTTVKKGKITRTTSEQVVKKKPESKTPIRGTSKPELLPSKTKQEKCITTKSIIINNETNEREVIVDLQRSKSSREPTPDRICPLPVSSDDESTPRYPDQIAEPDDSSLKRKPKKLSDIPILEGEDVTEFSRITEIEDTSSVNLVEETDISLLSVDKKINKFLDTTGKVRKPKQGPAPKVERPKLEVSEDLESDECLLSVSEKVNKFISTAEQLTTPQDLPQRPKSPKCQYYPDDEVSVSDKVAHFITTAEKVVTSQKEPAQKVRRPNFDDVAENIKRDDCLLSVSDKVSKFINATDRLTSDSKQSVSLSKMDTKQEEFYKKETTPTRKPSGQYSSVKTEVQEEKYPRRDSSPKLRESSPRSTKRPVEEETTPIRRPSNQYSSIKTEVHEEKYGRRDSSPKLADSTPKSTKRPTEDEPKTVLSPSSRLRSTESVKKAKALFENINKDQQVLKQRDILSRPSVFEGRKINKTETVRKLEYENDEDHKVLKSTKLLLEKAQARPRSPDKSHDVISRRSQSPDGDVPGYMRPLDRSLRPNSPHRDNISQISQTSKKYTTVKNEETTDVRHTKFGVSLRRTDSGRVVSTSAPSGRSRVSPEEVTEAEIEEIYDMEVLELLLEKIVDYEIRRKIRTQIRLVKKLITEDKLEEVTKRTTVRDTSPAKVVKQSRETTERTTEYHSSYAYNERRSSSEYTKVVRRSPSPDVRRSYVTRRSQSPEMKPSRVGRRSQSPEMKPSRVGRKSQSPETKSTRAPKRSQSPESKPVKSTRRSQSPETKPSRVTRRSQSPELRGKSPEKSSKITKLFQTQLKKTSPSSKTTVEDNTPEWVKQRNLKKVANTSVTTTKSSTTTTSKKSRSSPVKEAKPTDIITSSYGVGPTDENGSPLFGLKALRARNKTDTTKVQGTVIRSQYYSENGQEPVGEISVTKYSTDPRDLGRNEDTKSKGVTSITTTQKFGYKDTPSLKNLTNSKKKKEICEAIEDETETRTTKVTRRGSVKALSQKFIENAVETSKSERQSSYPKAGLILRTSSFKDSGSSGDSREGSTERTVTMKTSTRTVAGETFLTNRSKVTGVQDVISRMKSEDVREGDTAEDIEARGLLNKFLGAQVILSGIESNVKASSTTTNSKRITKVTTTITEGGKPVTKTRTFQHPVSEEELESVWDEQTLRLLLEQSTDYEERRQIRARLRQVMAEQEACTELVEKASQDQIGTTFEGESQLLPLLQGLLEAPDNEQTADSGTESGEDQRNGLIAEVQSALDKLSENLRDDATDITPERRTSLLQLVTKLQAGLAASVPSQERRSSVQSRFRRRQRPDRHTVGVSSEELADARRLIEEISLHELTPNQSKISLLQKQNSEGSVGQNSTASFKPFLPQKTVVKNAVAKPFSSSNSTVSGNSSSVQTPTDASECLDLLFNEDVEKKPDFSYRSISLDDQKIQRSSSGDVSIKSVQQAIQHAAARKSTENLLESEETDEDTTVKALAIKQEEKKEVPEEAHQSLPQPDVVMQSNPIYLQQKPVVVEDKSSKFNTKKLKMKRANTIDIPKPLKFYEDDDDSDCSLPDEDYHQRRRSNYLALRGPIRVGNPSGKNTVPVFEPKTDNDKKFLAFINKHNEDTPSKIVQTKNSLWSKPESNPGNIWNNKFGNIKTAFEKASSSAVQSQNSARQFWKTADDAITTGPKYDGPKISKQSARNLRQMFEEKQKQAQKVPWSSTQNDKNIVTGSLKVKAFEPHNEKTYKFVPQPLPVNKFSHAPQSAFKPLPKKTPPTLQISKTPLKSEVKEKDLDSPLFLYSPPKPSSESSLKPWVTSPGESRVLSLAASKFENPSQHHQEPVPVKPRKLSKDKVVLPFQQQAPEKLSAPYLVKSVEQKSNNIVRQLSGQYDNVDGRNPDYSTYSTVKYSSQPEKPQSYHQQYKSRQEYNPQYNAHNRYSATSQQYYPQNQQYVYQNQQYQGVPQKQQYQAVPQTQHYQGVPQTQQYQAVPQKPQYEVVPQQQQYQAVPQKQQYQAVPQKQQYQSVPQNQQYQSVPQNQQYQSVSQTQQYQSVPQTQQYQSVPQTQHYVYPQGERYLSENQQDNRPHPVYQHVPQYEPEPSNQQDNHPNPVYQHIPQQEPERSTPHETYEHTSQPKTAYDYYYSDKTQQYNEPQYTSTYQYQPQVQTPPSNYTEKQREERSEPRKEPVQTQPPKIQTQLSVENLKEYNAVNSRVMTGPVCQQATTVRQKSPMNRDEHDMAAALSLRNTLQKVSPRPDSSPQKMLEKELQKMTPPMSPSFKTKGESDKMACRNEENYRNVRASPTSPSKSSTYKEREEPPNIVSSTNYNYRPREPPRIVSPNSFTYRPREELPKPISPHSFSYKSRESVSSNSYNYRSNKRGAPVESLEINDNGESIVTSKFQIPVINVPQSESPRPPNPAQISNKAESWKQICLQNQQPLHKPSPRASPNARMVSKSKSSHSLAVPKQFEAGMSKDEMAHKRRTMEAFFNGGSKSPQSLSRTSSNDNLARQESKVVKRSINRLKTSEKVYRQPSALSRSRTLPDIVCPDLLDENNVDKAFEDLFKSSS